MKLVDFVFLIIHLYLVLALGKKRNITKTIFKLSFAKLFVNQSTKKPFNLNLHIGVSQEVAD